jgi:exodeoxyribonuclease VII large subunit
LKDNSLVLPERVYTVSQVTQLVKLELENAFPLLWVEGEVSNFHRHSSGHLYFTLKDVSSQLRTVMFRSEARRLRFDLSDGLQIICRGRINVYEPRGEYQLVVELAEPKGKGALQLAFEQLKIKLQAEGLFDPEHKKKLPQFPRKVGIVTSPRGAALVDILRILERRFARLEILIYPAKVQGEGAAEEIVEGIEYLGRLSDLDVIIVGRGGGSIEDLWAFNKEKVARAIFRCPIPIISAVGHEVDFTIADFVADLRASTPSAAAEMVIEREAALLERIENLEKRLIQDTRFALGEKKSQIIRLAYHRIFENFKVRLLNLEQRVDDLEVRAWNVVRDEHRLIREYRSRVVLFQEKIRNCLAGSLQELRGKWERLSSELNGASPLNILKKGYTLCWREDGLLARRIEDVATGKGMTVSFSKGEFTCLVKTIDKTRKIESRLMKESK